MKLIYITGIDGCGKTTQSKILTTYLNKQNINTQYQWLRWSPSIVKFISMLRKNNSEIGKQNKIKVIKNASEIQYEEDQNFTKWSEFKKRLFSVWLFRFLWLKYSTFDYYYAYKKVSSNWNADILVLDRYYFDYLVDQSINYNESVADFETRVSNGVLKNIKKPDIFIIISITPETGWQRKKDGTSMKHLQRLEKIYSSVQSSKKVHVIDGSQSPELVHNDIKCILSKCNLL